MPRNEVVFYIRTSVTKDRWRERAKGSGTGVWPGIAFRCRFAVLTVVQPSTAPPTLGESSVLCCFFPAAAVLTCVKSCLVAARLWRT